MAPPDVAAPDPANGGPLRIGLTGGVASGKSTVADAFTALGVPVISADAIAHELTAPGSPALDEIRAQFGNGVFDAGGALDRDALGERVFTDPAARAKLEAILHPEIRARMLAAAAALDDAYCILEIPLLAPDHPGTLVDRVLVVDAPEESQLARLQARDGITRERAGRVLTAQLPRDTRLGMADDVLDNSGDASAIDAAVQRLHGFYLDLARAGEPGRPGLRLP